MRTINFTYRGTINEQSIIGEGNLSANPENGLFEASVKFETIPPEFHPMASGFSLISISCSNGGGARTASNIFSITSGPYQSIRTVSIVDQETKISVGLFRIHGRFSSPHENETVHADVRLSGSYHGPSEFDLSSFRGYELSTVPVTGLNVPALFGITRIPILHSNGKLLATHEHIYLFEAGINEHLVANTMKFEVKDSQWDFDTKQLTLNGLSEMHLLNPEISPLQWID